jgi:uncharacterized protein YndB with AHSA1/START domain
MTSEVTMASLANEKLILLNKVSSASVLKHTNKNWDQWVKVLDKAGAKDWSHKVIVDYLVKKHKLSLWWRQIVASSYEVNIGRKIEGQNKNGEYATVATKTLNVDSKKVWKFLTSPEGLALWLKPLSPLKIQLKAQYETEGGAFGEIRTMKAGQRIRMSWQDSDGEKQTIVQFMVHHRKKDNCMVIIQHEKLQNGRVKNRMLAQWKQALNDIADYFSA